MLLFLRIMLTEFIAEMGDKTQLMLVALTSKYKIKDIILGTAAAVLVLNGLAVVAGGLVGALIPQYIIKLIAAAAFIFFALSSLKSDEEEEEAESKAKFAFAPLTVFCTFFVAELGDKTQLTAATFGASEGLSQAVIVWLACSVGLFAADIIGMLIGYLLKSKMPEGVLNIIAFIIFAIYGVLTTRVGLLMLNEEKALAIPVMPITVAVAVIIAVVSAVMLVKRSKS